MSQQSHSEKRDPQWTVDVVKNQVGAAYQEVDYDLHFIIRHRKTGKIWKRFKGYVETGPEGHIYAASGVQEVRISDDGSFIEVYETNLQAPRLIPCSQHHWL